MENLYKSDYNQWAQQQKELLKAGRFDALDIDNLIEELGDVGTSSQHAIESHLINLILHLLKYQYQMTVINPQCFDNGYEPEHFRSWTDSISNARRELTRWLRKNPSLGSHLAAILPQCYLEAKADAIREMNRYLPKNQWLTDESYPPQCPWSIEQMRDSEWLPGD